MIKAYIAHAMTGRSGRELHEESHAARLILGYYGIQVLDPVAAEGVDPETAALSNSLDELAYHWKRDKALIREAHLLIDLTPHLKSEGVSHEIGYARYFLWKPVVRVGKEFPIDSIAHFEDDIIVPDLHAAADAILGQYGTAWKRFKWRARLYLRSYIKACWYKLREWK